MAVFFLCELVLELFGSINCVFTNNQPIETHNFDVMTEEDGGGESFVCLLFYFLITQQNECMQIERWCGWLRLYNAVVTIFQTVDNYLRKFLFRVISIFKCFSDFN